MVAFDRVAHADVVRAMKDSIALGLSGSFLSMASPRPRLTNSSLKDAITRQRRSWARLMSSLRESDLAQATSSAASQGPVMVLGQLGFMVQEK
jgi:hypothetical protein